jgi:hypothetical protein
MLHAAAPAAAQPAGPPDLAPAAEPGWLRWAGLLACLALAAWLYIGAEWPHARQGGFDHNLWEALALLHGHVATPPPPSTGDMAHFHGHWYSFFPPLPAFLLVPWLWWRHGQIARVHVPLLADLLGVASAGAVYQIGERAGLRLGPRLAITAFFAFGTVFWYAVVQGTPWYYVQVCTVFFYVLCLRESFGANRPALVGSLFGAALLCRNPVALGFPFLFWRERRLQARRVAGLLVPIALAVGVQLWWNWARFGNPLDTGYSHILMADYLRPSFEEGMFSLRHLPWQLYSILLLAPGFHGQPNFNGVWPYLTLNGNGQSLTLTSPALIYTLDADIRRRPVWLAWISVLATAAPQLLYYANGWVQFGNRFSLDYTPLLVALLVLGIGRRLRWQHVLLILVSIALCMYGVAYGRGGLHLLSLHPGVRRP